MPTAIAGQPWPLELDFTDQENGNPADPDNVQLVITYGSSDEVVAGPFTYQGAGAATGGQVWRSGTGVYHFDWPVPYDARGGTYVASWTCQFGGKTWPGWEDFYVIGGVVLPVPAGDVGYWTGGITYGSQAIECGQVDADGICWLWNKLDGWDGTDVQGAGVIAQAGDHGGIPSPQYLAARALTWTVTASAPSQALRDLARLKLHAACPINGLGLFRYDEPIPKQAMVRRAGKISETYPTLADVEFSVLLIAPDPRKYGTQQHTQLIDAPPAVPVGVTVPFTMPMTLPSQPVGGSNGITNAGNFETRPVVSIYGPMTGPSLTNVTTGQTVSWSSLTIPAGGVLTVDFASKQAKLSTGAGDAAYRSADPFSSWWQLDPGMSTIQLGGTPGAGASAIVAWSDAFE